MFFNSMVKSISLRCSVCSGGTVHFGPETGVQFAPILVYSLLRYEVFSLTGISNILNELDNSILNFLIIF